VFSAEQVFTEIYIRKLLPAGVRSHRGRHRRRRLSQRPFPRPGRHADNFTWRYGRIRRSGRNLANRSEGPILAGAIVMALAGLMMFAFGLTFANFTALASEPQGHIAGTVSRFTGQSPPYLASGSAQ
jgi:MFS transporter, DHA1 family, multidrug resistance protein